MSNFTHLGKSHKMVESEDQRGSTPNNNIHDVCLVCAMSGSRTATASIARQTQAIALRAHLVTVAASGSTLDVQRDTVGYQDRSLEQPHSGQLRACDGGGDCYARLRVYRVQQSLHRTFLVHEGISCKHEAMVFARSKQRENTFIRKALPSTGGCDEED